MGSLVYDSRLSVPLDDRTLAHLQVVVLGKLRRRESFAFTATVDGREVGLWLGPSVALEFRYSERGRPAMNRAWLVLLADAASSRDGLVIVAEPVEVPAAAPIRRTAPVPIPAPATPARAPRPRRLPDVA
ncbi:DUF7882 family protein [Agromyces sp. ZXT2-3]|uniref:DUF7882 family protein n=1 Tax=Agromyces sp. ZXT2-3 TaxID=3461152 RepID=UPI00405511A6